MGELIVEKKKMKIHWEGSFIYNLTETA